METNEWDIGFLKYYDSATLMHCRVDDHIGTWKLGEKNSSKLDYLTITHSLRIQRARYIKKLHELCNQHTVFPGIHFQEGQKLDLKNVVVFWNQN